MSPEDVEMTALEPLATGTRLEERLWAGSDASEPGSSLDSVTETSDGGGMVPVDECACWDP
jgi:hypothetical protein